MLFSVIIPTYNEDRYIARCLASLQKQELETHDQMEIIIVDDGSTDMTIKKVKQFADIKLLHQQHQGPAIARNLGAKMARGEILIFVDADMEFEPDFIKHLVDPIKQGQVKGTFSKEEFVANWNNPIARCWNWNQDLPPKHKLPNDYPDEGEDFRAILKTEFQNVKGFDDVGYTDTWTLAKKLGYKPVNAPGAKYYHHNPNTFTETFWQAIWVNKRQYKLGFAGYMVALARSSLPVSLFIGIYKSVKFREPIFLLFKVIYDLAATLGILNLMITGNTSK